MLVCIAVTHEFLIRVYLMMTHKLEKHKRKLKVYQRTILVLLTMDFVGDGIRVCDPAYNSYDYYTMPVKTWKTILSIVIGIINLAITYKVKSQIRSKLNSMKNVYRTLTLGMQVTVIITFRLVLLWREPTLKSSYEELFNYTLIVYMITCELVTFTLLNAAIINDIYFLKKRYLAPLNQ